MGTVYQPIFFPRWRVRFVFNHSGGPMLAESIWWRTQEEAEKHAMYFLDGKSCGNSDFYDFEQQRAAAATVGRER